MRDGRMLPGGGKEWEKQKVPTSGLLSLPSALVVHSAPAAFYRRLTWALRDSNLRPYACEAYALNQLS